MENEKYVFSDLRSMCRLCSAPTTLVNIFDTRLEENDNLAEIVEVTTGVRISPTDEISQMLCQKCTNLTIMMFKFRTTSMLHDLELREKAFKQRAIDKSVRELLQNYPKLIIPSNITKLNISPRVSLRKCETSLTQKNYATVLKKRKTDERCSDPGKKIAETRVESTLLPSIHKNVEMSMAATQHLAENIILGEPAVKKLKLNEKLPNQQDIQKVNELNLKLNQNLPNQEEHDKQKVNELKLKLNEKLPNREEQDKQKVNELKKQDEIEIQREVEHLKQKEIGQSREDREKREEKEGKDKKMEGQKKEEREKHEDKERKKIEMEGQQEEITPEEMEVSRESDNSLFIVKQIHKRTYVCEMCARVYYTMKELKKHQFIHRRCSLCKAVVGDITKMREHEKTCPIRNIMNNLPTINIRRCDEIEEIRKKYSAFEFLNVIEISDDEDISSEISNKNVIGAIENNIDNAKKNTETIQQSPIANTTNKEKKAFSEISGPSTPTSKEDNHVNPGKQMETSTVVESRIPSSDNLEKKKDKVKPLKNSYKSKREVNKEIQIHSDKTETTSATAGTSSSSNLKRKNEKFSIAKDSKKQKKKVPYAEEISPQTSSDPIFPPKLSITDGSAICFDMEEEEMSCLKKLLRQIRNNEKLVSTCTQTNSPTNSDISYSDPNEEESYVSLVDLRNHLSYSNIPVNISHNKLYTIKFTYENCSVNSYKNTRAKSKNNIILRNKHDKKVHERMKHNRDIAKKRRNSDSPDIIKKGDGNPTKHAQKRKSVEKEIFKTNETSPTKIESISNNVKKRRKSNTLVSIKKGDGNPTNAKKRKSVEKEITKTNERELEQNGSNKSNPETIVQSQENRMITVSNKSPSMESVESNISSCEIRNMTDQIVNKLMMIGNQQPSKIVEISPRNQSVGLAKCSKKNTAAPPKINEKKFITRNVQILPKPTHMGPPKSSTKNIEPLTPISETTNTKQVRKELTEIEKIKLVENQLFPPSTTVANCSNANATGISGVSTQAQTFIGNTISLLNPTVTNSNSATAGSNVYRIGGGSGVVSNASNFPMMAYQMNNSQPVQNPNVQPTLGPLYVVNNNLLNSMKLVTPNQLQPNNSSPVTTTNIFNSTAPVVVSNSLVNAQLPVLNSTSTMSNQIPVVYSGQFQQNRQNFVTMQNPIPPLFTRNSNTSIPVSLAGPNTIITCQGQGMAPSFVSTSSVQHPSAPSSCHIPPLTTPIPSASSQSTPLILPKSSSQNSKTHEPVFVSPRPPPMRKISDHPRIRIVSHLDIHGKKDKVGQNPPLPQNVQQEPTTTDSTKYIRVRNLSELR